MLISSSLKFQRPGQFPERIHDNWTGRHTNSASNSPGDGAIAWRMSPREKLRNGLDTVLDG